MNEDNREKTGKAIVIGIVIFLVVSLLIGALAYFLIVAKIKKTSNDIFDKGLGIADKIIDKVVEDIDNKDTNIKDSKDIIDKASEGADNIVKEAKKYEFNRELEASIGELSGSQLKSLLDKVNLKIKKSPEHKITVIHNETKAADAEQIVEIKKTIQDTAKYEILFDYDTEGFINQITISD